MFKRSVMWLSALFLLALVSRPLFTAVHSRIARPEQRTPAKSGINPKEKRAKEHQPNKDYGKLPLYFERNVGQTGPHVKFIARGGEATTFLTATEAVFSLPIADFQLPTGYTDEDRLRNEAHFGLQAFDVGILIARSRRRNPKSAIANRRSAITMRLVGANANAKVEGLDRLPGISNYFIGNDPSQWRTNVPHFAKVRYRDVYPDIDLVYYGNER